MVSKIKFNDKLDILYVLDNYKGELFDLSSPFKYGGIYDKENNKVFDPEYSVRTYLLKWDYRDNRSITLSELYNMLNKDVNEKITDLIDSDKDNIFNISEVEISEEIEDKDVLDDFMNEKTSKTLENSYIKYSTNKPSDVLDYLTDKNEFIEEEARDFIIDNNTSILKGLAITEERRKALKRIEDNKEHPYHKIKSIVDTIKDKNCVTVNLTINKNGIEQTFKYSADILKNHYNSTYLSPFNIEKASERELYEETFGRWDDFHYEDIVKITYGKNTIYEDLSFKNNENSEEICL